MTVDVNMYGYRVVRLNGGDDLELNVRNHFNVERD